MTHGFGMRANIQNEFSYPSVRTGIVPDESRGLPEMLRLGSVICADCCKLRHQHHA
jgi:hypothetical protein